MGRFDFTALKELNPDIKDAKEFDVIAENSLPNGRSYYTCECPFCNRRVRIQKWSYTTTGKKCDCGAILRSGYAVMK